ncbi:MAG: hypothetical protein COA96_15615 [SAR86 cluster bacterium]|uniref:Uncharacterized protein n=1 Tax=SAR86 cluster bacterium TaxID=2030880 RepID=A0A2A5ANL7_9GAMM|nr:MAG: hypothetical protein COA96_15615 [SAR86 cluster bacterium]
MANIEIKSGAAEQKFLKSKGAGTDAAPFVPEHTISLTESLSDAFGRLRTSQPLALFAGKQILDNEPLFWDEGLESGGGITSNWVKDEAATTITSTLNTAGVFTRQTFQRFNYQPGKSQLITMTGTLDLSGGGTGVQRRVGQFDDENGLFFEDDEGTVKVVMRSKVSGSVVDSKTTQASWNLDVMDGTGESGITVDWSKSQIFVIDYKWLSVGRIRYGLDINGAVHYVHAFNNANVNAGAYMSTPNLPLRYQIVTTSSSPASTFLCICATIISEGGTSELGINRYVSTGNTHVNANIAGTIYAVVGMRLKSTHLGAVVKQVAISALSKTADDFEWLLILNPTVAGTFTYSGETDSPIEAAFGATANTVTGGYIMAGDFIATASGASAALNNERYMGSAIDGTPDEVVLCTRPLGANADIVGSITYKEVT